MRAGLAILMIACAGASACTRPAQENAASPGARGNVADPTLTAFIGRIRAVDNHTHVNAVVRDDPDSDALPLDSLVPFDLPIALRPENPAWLAAYRGLYNYPHADLSEAHLAELRAAILRVASVRGDTFPEWVLDRIGTRGHAGQSRGDGAGSRAARIRA